MDIFTLELYDSISFRNIGIFLIILLVIKLSAVIADIIVLAIGSIKRTNTKMTLLTKKHIKNRFVQLKNPKSNRWVKVDTHLGKIISVKKTPGPYIGIITKGKFK